MRTHVGQVVGAYVAPFNGVKTVETIGETVGTPCFANVRACYFC
jgi:hypothetical protein